MSLAVQEEHPNKWKMMDYFMLKCSMCLQDFSEERLPRNLQCAHSICSECADVRSHKVCPECYTAQIIRSVDDHKVNFPLAQLIESNCLKDIDISDVPLPLFPKDIPSSDIKQAVSICFGHANPTSLFCSTCCTWICDDCVVVDHMIPPRGDCRILGATDAMKMIRSEHKKLLDQNLKVITDMEEKLDFQYGLHEFCMKHCSAKDTSHSEVISQVENQLKAVKEKNDMHIRYLKERMKNSVDEVNSSLSAEIITANYNEFLRFQDALREDMANDNNKIQPAMKTMLKHLKMDLVELLKGDRTLFATYNVNGKVKRSKLIRKENSILLHCLTLGDSSTKGIEIPFEYVKKLIPQENTMLWFEVGTKKKSMGEFILRLRGPSIYTNQALLMNTGEKGHSYKDTRFHEYDEEEHCLEGGDYEDNDGCGECLLVNKDYFHKDSSECKPVAGEVFGDTNASTKFSIYLEDNTSPAYGVKFGRIIQGLDALKTAAKQKPVTKSRIRECGVLI